MYAFRNSGFTKEQLNNLGVTGKDVPIATQTPLFPPLISRPIEIDMNNVALDYKVMWKEDFRSRLFDVHSNAEPNLTDDSYSSKIANALEKEHKKKLQFKFAWTQLPSELKPQNKRKNAMKPVKVKRIKAIPKEEVEQKFEILEQKENMEGPDGDDKSVKAESDDEGDNEEEEKVDEEMDDELDYGNNYFDNGEGYNDEDDNLDEGDGPVY